MEKNNSSVGGDEVLVDGEGFEVGGLGGKAHCAADSQLRCLIQTSFALFSCASTSQRAKNPVSASALLTGKFLRARKVFARLIYNSSLKGPHLSAQCKLHPCKMLFVSGQL